MLMLYSIRFFCFSLLLFCISCKEDGDGSAHGGLITQLRNDANLDLSVDEEYEDLRAELLAYHTALASLSADGEDLAGDDDDSKATRRSLGSTPCWQLGGICINHQLCTGFKFLTEVPGCKDKLNVCCFTWNRYQVRDMRDKGLGTLALPWKSIVYEFGGKGIQAASEEEEGGNKLKKWRSKKKKGNRGRKGDKKTTRKPRSNRNTKISAEVNVEVNNNYQATTEKDCSSDSIEELD